MAISQQLKDLLLSALGGHKERDEMVALLENQSTVGLSSDMLTLLTTSQAIIDAAAAAGLNTTTYLAQTLATAPAADILIFIKAAIKGGFFDIKQQMINAYDAVHSRQIPKLAKNMERIIVTQAHINQQFIDLQLSPMNGSSRVVLNGLDLLEGGTANPGVINAATNSIFTLGTGTGVLTVANGADYQMNYGGKYPVVYRVVNEVSARERTTVLINNIGSFFDTAGAAGKYFTINSAPNVLHYFWFKVTDAGSPAIDPTPGGTGHEVDILLADTAAQIATKLNTVVAALSTLFTSSVATTTVTITNFNIGAVTLATAATSGTTVTRTILGITSNLNNKYMAIAGTYINQFAQGAQPDMLIWFNVDSLGDSETVYLNSQSTWELKLNGLFPIQVNITSGSTAATIATAIATAIRQNVPTLFQIQEPAATLAVHQTIGSTTNTSTTVTLLDATNIVPGMPISGTGIPANTLVVSVSGLTIVLNNAATATAPGVQLTFNYIPIKIYKDEYNLCGVDTPIIPVSTLVNTGGRGFNMSNCFQVIGASDFNNSMVELGGRIGFNGIASAGGARNLSTISSPGTIASNSNRVSNFNIQRIGDLSIRNGQFVTGTNIPAGTTVASNSNGIVGMGMFTVKKIPGSRDLAVWDINTNTATTIAAYQTAAAASPTVLNGTLAAVTLSGDITFGNTTVVMASTTGLVAGMQVQGPYIPAGSTIVSIIVNTSIVISLAALATLSAQTLLFGSCLNVATQVQICSITNGSPYFTIATATPNIAHLMSIAGTGINAAALVMNVSISGGTTTVTMSHNATATNASASLTFSVSAGMLVSGTGIRAGTIIQAKSGTTLTLSSIPTTTGISSLSFQPYFPTIVSGTTMQANTALLTADQVPSAFQIFAVRSRTSGGGDIITGNYEIFEDALVYPFGMRVTTTNDIFLSQPATGTVSTALSFTILNPVQVKITDQAPLKVGDSLTIVYDVDDQTVPDYKIETNVPFGGPTWDGSDETIDTWMNQYAYFFTIPVSTISIGSVYSHNGFKYTVKTSITSGTSLYVDGTGVPLSSGTLILLSGTGPASLTFISPIQSTIDMPYRVKGEGIPILCLGFQTANDGDNSLNASWMLGALPTGKCYFISLPGCNRPWGSSVGGFTETQISDAAAWNNNSPGNPFSDFRMSSTIRAISSLIERFNCGPMFLAANSRNTVVCKKLYQARPDLVRGVMMGESFDNYFDNTPTYSGSGLSITPWISVGIQLPGVTTVGLNTINMGSGANNYTAGVWIGMPVSGTGIPAGATVTVVSTTSVTFGGSPATISGASQLVFGGASGSAVRGDHISEYCLSNDLVSSNPNIVIGTVTSGSKIITGITSTLGIIKGMSITGNGISSSDAPIGCSTTSGSTTISGISAGDWANIQVGMYVWGGGIPNGSAGFGTNVITLVSTTLPMVVSKPTGSTVVLSQPSSVTNTAELLWFVNQVTKVTPTSITLSSPALATNVNVSIRGRMIAHDSHFYKLVKLQSKKRSELHLGTINNTIKVGFSDNQQTSQSYAGGGNYAWALPNGVLPNGPTQYKQNAAYTQTPVVTSADDGTHPNMWFDTSLYSFDIKQAIVGFSVGSALNIQNTSVGTGAPISFDNGAGVGVDQGSGIYRNTSLSQPFKFWGGKTNTWLIQNRNSLSQGDTVANLQVGKLITTETGADLPNPTATQLKARCQGIPFLRFEGANAWNFMNPQTNGWQSSICIGESLQWVLGPDLVVLSLNPFNDAGSGPFNNSPSYILNQYINVGGGLSDNARSWQIARNLIKLKL